MAGEAQREALLSALYARLSGDATLSSLATGGVHLVRAPAGTAAPYVVARTRPGGRIEQTLGNGRALRYVNVEVVGVVAGAGTVTAERIDERIEALLSDHALSVVSPYVASPMRRIADLDSPVFDDGVEFDQVGGLYRVPISSGSA